MAQDEARGLGHNHIGTEHLLLGLLREEEGTPALLLRSLGVTAEAARERVEQIVGRGGTVVSTQLPFTPRAKKVLEQALREAMGRQHREIGPEHVLLGLLHEREGVAARVLSELGAPPEQVGAELSALIEQEPEGGEHEAERVRAEKEAAIEAQDFHRAAVLRARERKLMREEVPTAASASGSLSTAPAFPQAVPLGLVVGVVLLGLGILIGWAIWG